MTTKSAKKSPSPRTSARGAGATKSEGRVKLQTSATARAAAGAAGKGKTRSKSGAGKASASKVSVSKAAKPIKGATASKAKRREPAGNGKAAKPARAAAAVAELATESERDRERRALARVGAELAIESALDKKALGPVLIDVSSQASYTDYIGVVSGRSDRQVEAIADHVCHAMKKNGYTLVGREGTSNGRWTLLDFGDMILHIFYHPIREVYDIEGLWVGAPRVTLKNVPPEAMNFQADALYVQP